VEIRQLVVSQNQVEEIQPALLDKVAMATTKAEVGAAVITEAQAASTFRVEEVAVATPIRDILSIPMHKVFTTVTVFSSCL